ncbi:hypothetical protein RhiJN_23099 [Ceratobasidium sp. AG-Ba]|nr:hypothetical protein RhiJN_23099 [Ceratobasidium sp. AG-Ba]
MSVQDATREKRVSVKTTRMLEYEADRAKSRETSNLIARTKHVRAEEAELLEKDNHSEEEFAKVQATKSRKKATAPPLDEDEDCRDGSGLSGRRLELVFMIHGRHETPLAELEPLTLAQLEDRWKNGPPKGSVQAKGKNKASNPAPKASTAKTPAKGVRASKPAVSQVAMIGSPLVVWKEAQEEAARAEYTPVPKKRTQDLSVESAGEPRRPLDLKGKLDEARGSTKPLPTGTISSTSSRAGSVPANVTSRSKSVIPPSRPSRNQTEEPEGEVFDMEIEPGTDEDQMERPVVKPKTKKSGKNSSNQDAKPRAKRGNYKDSGITTMLIDRAHEETLVSFRLDMCAGPDEITLMVHKGWAKAVAHYQQPADDWQIDANLTRVIKSLVHGFRSRARQRLTRSILSHFGLELSADRTVEDIKESAAKLLPTRFHRDPKAKNEDEGNYQNPIISRGLANIWFSGTKPTAFRFPDSMNPIPTKSVAYVAALTHDILARVARDGPLKAESKSGGDTGEQEGASDKKGSRANIDPVKALMTVHLGNLLTFEEADAGAYDDFLDELRKAALACVGKSEEKPKRADENLAPGTLLAASFAGERKYLAARARPASNTHNTQIRPAPRPHLSTTRTSTVESSKLARVNERSDEVAEIGTQPAPVAAHPKTGRAYQPLGDESDHSRPPTPVLQDDRPIEDDTESIIDDREMMRDKSPGGGEIAEIENERSEDKVRSRGVGSTVDERDEGESEVQVSAGADGVSRKRKPHVVEVDHEEDERSEDEPEDELPAKKPRLAKRSVIPDSNSDDEVGETWSGGPDSQAISGEASKDASAIPSRAGETGGRLSKASLGEPNGSSPLSTPEASPVVSKRETRLSTKGRQTDKSDTEAATRMAGVLERRKAMEEAKRTQAAVKKKKDQDEAALEDQLWKETEKEVRGKVATQSKKSRKK